MLTDQRNLYKQKLNIYLNWQPTILRLYIYKIGIDWRQTKHGIQTKLFLFQVLEEIQHQKLTAIQLIQIRTILCRMS